MPSLKAIRKRINSVKSTQKITRAMKMIAGARLNRAQAKILALRPYALKTADVVLAVGNQVARTTHTEAEKQEGLVHQAEESLHPLLQRRQERTALMFVITSDRGLCGAFNTNVCRAVEKLWREKEAAGISVKFITVGRKGRDYFQRRKAEILRDFSGKEYENVTLEQARSISQVLTKLYRRSEVDTVYVTFNEFHSVISQRVTFLQLLPLPIDLDAPAPEVEMIFEPNASALLDRLVPMYVEISILRAILESRAGEHGARMTAMDNATRNAKEMIDSLTLDYNRARQASITKELMEIIGGAEALKD
jgi:F-type H+-transporting ATPase subunit gamma